MQEISAVTFDTWGNVGCVFIRGAGFDPSADAQFHAQLFEQSFGLLHVYPIEAFGEPVVDRCLELLTTET